MPSDVKAATDSGHGKERTAVLTTVTLLRREIHSRESLKQRGQEEQN